MSDQRVTVLRVDGSAVSVELPAEYVEPVYRTCRRCQHRPHKPLPRERVVSPAGGACDCSCHDAAT